MFLWFLWFVSCHLTPSLQESNDQNRNKAKQDVEQLLGKGDKKKKKSVKSIEIPPPIVSSGSAGLGRKPLPGIAALGQPRLLSSSLDGGLDAFKTMGVSNNGVDSLKGKAPGKLISTLSSESESKQQHDVQVFAQSDFKYVTLSLPHIEQRVDPLALLCTGWTDTPPRWARRPSLAWRRPPAR